MKRILIVVGEASADRYGARLVRKLKLLHRTGESLHFFGTGGDAMQAEGVEILGHIRDLANIGPREALAHFRKYYDTFHALVRCCSENPPSLAVLLDFPEFNLRLAKKIKQAGIRVIYYISPQIWAWRSGRIWVIRKYVDKMLVILPFEEEYYRQRGISAEFVGHPLVEDFSPSRNRKSFLSRLNLDPDRTTVALLPGSRRREVEYILPTLLRASQKILQARPAQFLVSVAPSVEMGIVHRLLARVLQEDSNALNFRLVASESRDLLANSDFGLVKSGTSTLEAALVGTPFLIVYKISPLSWHLGNILIRSPFKGLVNLIAEEQIVPEYLQREATPEALAGAALDYLERPEKAAAMRSRLAWVREKLSIRSASETAAAVVEQYL